MSDPAGFETSIKPLFRELDRDSMSGSFDLWDYDDVREHAAAILARVEQGDMPCDTPWPSERVAVFSAWVDAGMPR